MMMKRLLAISSLVEDLSLKMMMMMKRLLLWWSSPTTLLRSIIKFTIPSLLIALFIIKFGPLDNNISTPHSRHLNQKVTQEELIAAKNQINRRIKFHSKEQHTPLGFRITDWDAQRKTFLAQNAGPVRRYADGHLRPNILLVTGSSPKACHNPVGDHLLLQFTKNKIDYCRLHGIDIFYSMALLNSDMPDCWSKLPLIRKLMLLHPEMEWIWWMDSDAAFTDMTFELPIDKYDQYNLVLHGWGHEIYGLKKSWVGLNAGVFLIRNCQWSLDFMDAWAFLGENQKVRDELGPFLSKYLTNRPVFESDDQASLIYILNAQKAKWGNKVFLESSYFLHGYWEIIVDRYEELMESSHAGYGDERWPFVTHFVGCKPCGKQGVEKRCLKHMERAFNFADNQVLKHYGFEHKHLSTFEVVGRDANETM